MFWISNIIFYSLGNSSFAFYLFNMYALYRDIMLIVKTFLLMSCNGYLLIDFIWTLISPLYLMLLFWPKQSVCTALKHCSGRVVYNIFSWLFWFLFMFSCIHQPASLQKALGAVYTSKNSPPILTSHPVISVIKS